MVLCRLREVLLEETEVCVSSANCFVGRRRLGDGLGRWSGLSSIVCSQFGRDIGRNRGSLRGRWKGVRFDDTNVCIFGLGKSLASKNCLTWMDHAYNCRSLVCLDFLQIKVLNKIYGHIRNEKLLRFDKLNRLPFRATTEEENKRARDAFWAFKNWNINAKSRVYPLE